MENQVCALAQHAVLATVKGGNPICLQDMNILSLHPLFNSLNLMKLQTEGRAAASGKPQLLLGMLPLKNVPIRDYFLPALCVLGAMAVPILARAL